ncbi:MAG TPA: uroporphyrinogen decarboxylase [Terriglobales bacterium]|nr:uroporphyrinogen decarboxylase [Terriglobales bacterium]
MSAPNSAFVRACKGQATPITPVWFMRQAGRYMAEYRAVRKHHSLLEICKRPVLAAEVTITAAEALGVDAAIIFADLLLPFEVMGLKFHFASGEGPVIEAPLRGPKEIKRLRVDGADGLSYVSEAVRLVVRHFGEKLPVIGFCGAPFTLASYMVEGRGSRNYAETKKLMYREPEAWDELMRKLVAVLSEYSAQQAQAGADVIQIFDSWAGCLSPDDYRQYVLPRTTELVRNVQQAGVPVIYFGTDTATLLPAMKETGAEVIGVDWRISLDDAWASLEYRGAVQGNLDPVALFANWKDLRARAEEVLRRAGGRPGHIFNLGHGILPDTPVENVRALARFVHEHSAKAATVTK